MEIARIEDTFPLKGHLVLGAIVLVEGMNTKAEVKALFGEKVILQTPANERFLADILELNVHQSIGGVTQVMVGINPPEGREIPKGTTIHSEF